jgi:hypothetical protein
MVQAMRAVERSISCRGDLALLVVVCVLEQIIAIQGGRRGERRLRIWPSLVLL